MKRIYSSQNTLMVDHLQHVLDAEGIECVVRNRDLANLAGRVPHDQCFVELWVAHDIDFEAAKRVVDRAFAEPADTRVWNCLACGEQVEKAFDQCWNCGAVKGEHEIAKDFGKTPERRPPEPISKEALYWAAWVVMALIAIAMLRAYTG